MEFSSKSNVLKSLKKSLKKSKIEKIYDFSVSNWVENEKIILDEISNNFQSKIIVRSSAIGEDSVNSSEAGSYESILNVPSNSKNKIKSAINSIIFSYNQKGNFNQNNQILIQNQTSNVIMSGVIFTKTEDIGAPYYVINYDDGENTDTVTKGEINKVVKIFRSPSTKINKKFRKIIESIKEIEGIFNQYYLDIEFALTKSNEVVIFQVRPITFIKNCNSISEKKIGKIGKKDLTIITTPINLLTRAATLAIKSGQENILIEKPGSLFKTDLILLEKLIKKQKVRIAYNRLFYPNFQKLKILTEMDGGITSCKFDFTEWVHTIPFGKYKKEVYRRWGISNSLHVISMAMELIGMPEKITTNQYGNLKWHPTSSIFVGNGISGKKIPFSYHANWEGAGRWGIEVVTKKNIYRLSPLEKLFVSKKGSPEWKEIQIKNRFPKIKMGLAEEIITMLDDVLEKQLKMVTIKRAIEYNKLAEKIFAYKN